MSSGKIQKPVLRQTDTVHDGQLTDPKDDLFSYDEIAGRVAELVAGAESPVHVGVFAPWGAGKSSFLGLLERQLKTLAGTQTPDGVRYPRRFLVVRYDAWRYGGQALRRDLIAVAARSLEIRRRRYTGGLFESRQVVRLELDEIVRRAGAFIKGVLGVLLATSLALFVLGSVVWLIHLAVTSVPSPATLLHDWNLPLGRILSGIGAVVALLNVPNLIGVSVNRSSPSQDDEFAHNLKRLIREAELPRLLRWLRYAKPLAKMVRQLARRRVVFFIDELDRASDTDVLQTLTALQTQFADADVSVIVAADRAVIDKAVASEERQAGPTREWSIHLSRADAFLDKIFQHTFSLPPLRTERVTKYARALVSGQAGLWREIEQEGLTDDIIYALIPGHVRSPRRIKVLLNAYATQTRVAEARGLPVATLRRDLAQWVVFQLEFPDFASDILVEPRLKSLLREDRELKGVQARLASNHRARLEPPPTADAAEWLAWSTSQFLRDYLDRVAHIPDPPLELLFLEPAGSAIGRFTPEVAHTLDRADEGNVDSSLSTLADLDRAGRDAAIQYLAERSRDALSVGRDRLIAVMAHLIHEQGPGPLRPLKSAVEAMRPYRHGGRSIERRVLPTYIRVFMEADDPEGVRHGLSRVGDDSPDGYTVAQLFEVMHVPESRSDATLQELAEWIVDHVDEAAVATLAQTEDWALANSCLLHDSESLFLAVAESTSESAAAFVRIVRQSSTVAKEVLARAVSDYLQTAAAVPEVVLQLTSNGAVGPESTTTIAVAVLHHLADADADFWSSRVTSQPDPKQLSAAIRVLVRRMALTNTDQEWSVLSTAIEHLHSFETTEEIGSIFAERLNELPWTAQTAAQRASLGRRACSLLQRIGSGQLSDIAGAELLGAVPFVKAGVIAPEDAFQFHGAVSDEVLLKADEALDDNATGTMLEKLRNLRARIWLRGSPVTLPPLTPSMVGTQLKTALASNEDLTAIAAAVIKEWFSDGRSDREVIALTTAAGRVWTDELAKWAATVSATRLTNVWIVLARGFKRPVLMRIGGVQELDGAKLEKYLRPLAESEDETERRKAVDLVRSLPQTRGDAQRVAQVVASALATRGPEERRTAARLVSDYAPRRFSAEARAALRHIPFSAWGRKVDKRVADRLGIKRPKRRRRKG